MDIQTKIWDKDIQKLIKKGDIQGLENYKKVIERASNIDDAIKAEYIEKCNIDASEVTVGESARHFKMSKKTAIKVATAAAIIAMAGTVIHGCSNSSNAKDKSNSKPATIKPVATKEAETNLNNEKEEKTIKPTLAFDTENTEVMIENLKGFVKASLPNGIEFTDEELEEQVESLVNYYVWLNLNEIGPSYLSELYQTDSVSYIEIFSDSMYWANVLRFDSITSSAKDNTIIDLSTLISNKKDRALVESFQNLNGRLHDAVNDDDKEKIDSIVSEYKKLIETKLLDHESYTYGEGVLDLCFRMVYSGEQLLANYDLKIMDDSLAEIINKDVRLRCIYAISFNTKEDKNYTKEELGQLVQTNTSKKSDNVIYQIDVLKDYILRLNMQKDFTGKKSVAVIMFEVSKHVRDNDLLSTHKKNEPLDVFFDRSYNQTHEKVETIKKDDVVINNNEQYIGKSELDKHNVKNENKKPQEIKKEYEEKVKEEKNKELENQKEFEDNAGNTLKTDKDSDYWAGWYAGNKKGAADGNNLADKEPTTTGSENFKKGYAFGYNEAYDAAKKARLEAEKEIIVEITPIDPIIQSSEVIGDGIVENTNSPEATNTPEPTNAPVATTTPAPTTTPEPTKAPVATTTPAPTATPKPTSTPAPTTGVIIEKEVYEEGLLPTGSEDSKDSNNEFATMSLDQLKQMRQMCDNASYYNLEDTVLYEEETTVKVKTR